MTTKRNYYPKGESMSRTKQPSQNTCRGCRENLHVLDGTHHLTDTGERIRCVAGGHLLKCRALGAEYELACDVIGQRSDGRKEVRIYGRQSDPGGNTIYDWTQHVSADRLRPKEVSP